MLAAGSYSGTVTISKQGESPEMQVIPVGLTLTEPSVPPVVPPPVTGPGDKSRKIKWTSTEIFQGMSLQDIWGESTTSLFAVGSEGAILRYNGKGWAKMESGVTENLFGIWGSSRSDVFAVGENGPWSSARTSLPGCVPWKVRPDIVRDRERYRQSALISGQVLTEVKSWRPRFQGWEKMIGVMPACSS
jgi:hypothetical protein